MDHINYLQIIEDLTRRALWEVKNVIDCVPDAMWERKYCYQPLWKHIFHMFHSLDTWYINPKDDAYEQPSVWEEGLDDLDHVSSKKLSRKEIEDYYETISKKIMDYVAGLKETELLIYPANCPYTKFTLILGQFRHLHTHMGMIMGFIVEATGKWPRVLGLENPIPKGAYEKFD